jgi:hypothetical protein
MDVRFATGPQLSVKIQGEDGEGNGQDQATDFPANHQRLTATIDHATSTSPNGQAPCRNPYVEPNAQAPANARVYQRLRRSKA